MEIKIEGVAPNIDGTYELPTQLTTRELHEVKTVSGVTPDGIGAAYANGDAAFKAVIAAIAVRRAGKIVPLEILLDSPYTAAAYAFPEIEAALKADDDPPTTRSPRKTSGTRSKSTSASRAADRRRSGEQT